MEIQDADVARHKIIESQKEARDHWCELAETGGTPAVNDEYLRCREALKVNKAALEAKDFTVVSETVIEDRIRKLSRLIGTFIASRNIIKSRIPELIYR